MVRTEDCSYYNGESYDTYIAGNNALERKKKQSGEE
jgi:hypothetical protein